MSDPNEPRPNLPRTNREFVLLLLHKILQARKYYLLPLWILVVLIALVLVLSGHGHILPAIYVLF